MLKKDTQILLKHSSHGLAELYDKYAGMLLGYIYDIVDDSKLAEQHLVSIYSGLSVNYKELIPDGENTWCYLQRLAKKHLSGFQEGLKEPKLKGIDFNNKNDRNRFLKLMTHEQKEVFCGIYHYGKTVTKLSKELNIAEDTVRRTLKEAFAIIKQAS
ncbi:sigma-70 RNA polymerase sigma factor region 4 domain-containing protein [Mucilaginibacter sp.]